METLFLTFKKNLVSLIIGSVTTQLNQSLSMRFEKCLKICEISNLNTFLPFSMKFRQIPPIFEPKVQIFQT